MANSFQAGVFSCITERLKWYFQEQDKCQQYLTWLNINVGLRTKKLSVLFSVGWCSWHGGN